MKIKNKLTVGIPIYNEEKNIDKLINSLNKQTFKNFNVIFSNNASTDNTKKKLSRFKKKNKKVKIFNQKKNIGSYKNFKFVFDKVKTKYFMWLAADDKISKNFIKNNLNFLEKNQNFVGSTSKNSYDWNRKFSIYNDKKFVNFRLDQELNTNLLKFLKNIDYSHAIFYSIFRTEILKKCEVIKKNFYASDWAIMLFMIGQGKINRDLKSNIIFGTKGASYKKGSYSEIFKKNPPKFPLWFFSLYLFDFVLKKKINLINIIYVIFWIVKKNLLFFKKKI